MSEVDLGNYIRGQSRRLGISPNDYVRMLGGSDFVPDPIGLQKSMANAREKNRHVSDLSEQLGWEEICSVPAIFGNELSEDIYIFRDPSGGFHKAWEICVPIGDEWEMLSDDVEIDRQEALRIIARNLVPEEFHDDLGLNSSSFGRLAEIEAKAGAIPFGTDEFEIVAAGRQASTLLELQRELIVDLAGNLSEGDWRKERAIGLADLSWTVKEEVERGCAAAAETIEAAREAKFLS